MPAQFIIKHHKHNMFWSGQHWAPRGFAQIYTEAQIQDVSNLVAEGEWRRTKDSVDDEIPENVPRKYIGQDAEPKKRCGYYLTESFIALLEAESEKSHVPLSVLLELWARRGMKHYSETGEF